MDTSTISRTRTLAIAALGLFVTSVGSAIPDSIALSFNSGQPQPFAITGSSVSPDTTPGQYVRDFGDIDPIADKELVQDFVFKNTGAQRVSVTGLFPSCHCTTATISAGAQSATYKVGSAMQPSIGIDPGQAAMVHVTVSLDDVSPGLFTKSVTFKTDPAITPTPTILIKFKVEPPVALDPVVVNLGDVKAGQPAQGTVVAKIDHRLYGPSGFLPPLVSSNPYLLVSPASSSSGQPGAKPSDSKSATDTRTYTIRLLPSAPIGPVTATLYFGSDVPRTPAGVKPISAPPLLPAPANAGTKLSLPSTNLWSSARALVICNVTGDAKADPTSVLFGTIKPGATATQTVELDGSDKALADLKVEPNADWLTVTVGKDIPEQGAGVGQSTRQLVISAGPYMPSGSLSANIKIELGNGQKMMLPVNAYCASPAQQLVLPIPRK